MTRGSAFGKVTRGKILYLGDTVGERGREWFQRIDHPDGSMTIRTVSEIDDIPLLRDVTYAVDERLLPRDGYERLVVRGVTSMGWFQFGASEATCEGVYPDLGRVSQRVAIDQPAQYFACHPLCGDALDAAAYDLRVGGKQLLHGFNSSPLVNGSTGPILARASLLMELIGEETIEVPAGRFETRHFRYYYGPQKDKIQDVWCGPRCEFVKVRNEELQTNYLLAELEEGS